MRTPLPRPQTLTEAGGPGNSRFRSVKSLVADSPSTSTFTTPAPRKTLQQAAPRHSGTPHYESPCCRQPLAHSRTRKATQAVWPSGMPRCKTRRPERQAQTSSGKSGGHRRVVQYLRKRVCCATISVTHSRKSSGRLAQRERRCLTSTRSQVQILYRPPSKPQVRRFSSDLFFFQGNQGLIGQRRV